MFSPVKLAIPMNTSEPTPAEISPGIRMSGSIGPPRPVASMTRIAATMGDPKITEMAAKLPAAPTIIRSCAGESLRANFTQATATPDPSAISGASGPSTTPRPRLAKAASAIPGT